MPISDFLSNKWDEKLHNWILWLSTNADRQGAAKISSVYRPELSQHGYREGGHAVLSGDAMDTDKLMVKIQADKKHGIRIYRALVAWTINDGTRGAQAARLSTHQDTYKDWVDSGKRELERLSKLKTRQQSKTHPLLPDLLYD